MCSCAFTLFVGVSSLVLGDRPAAAQTTTAAAPTNGGTPAQPAPQLAPWSASEPAVVADVTAGRPLVTHVFVPLCSNEQINCGAKWAGNPAGLKTNIYWGAIYGARRFFEREDSGWERVELTSGDGSPLLERAVYRRWVPGERWGLPPEKRVEQLVVLSAIHGNRIDQAVGNFWELAQSSDDSPMFVEFVDGDATRRVRIHVAGYAGHNRLMDGVVLPAPKAEPNVDEAVRGIPSFVLACYSEKYFSRALRAAGSQQLVLTRTYMAPEGYVISALATALGDNLSAPAVRTRTVEAYAKWQRLTPKQAGAIFSEQSRAAQP